MKKFILIVSVMMAVIIAGLVYVVSNINNFNVATVVASVVNETGGTISNVGEHTYKRGEDVEYVITANSGYHIKTLIVNNSLQIRSEDLKQNATYIFRNIKNANTISVEFEKNIQLLSIALDGNGTIELQEHKSFSYIGDSITYVIKPNKLSDGGLRNIKTLKVNNVYQEVSDLLAKSETDEVYMRFDEETSSYLLTLNNIQTDVYIEVGFEIEINFVYDLSTGSKKMESFSDENTVDFFYDYTNPNHDYFRIANDVVNNKPADKTFIGWNYKVWTNSPDETEVETFIVNSITALYSNVNNSNNKNITFYAVYE